MVSLSKMNDTVRETVTELIKYSSRLNDLVAESKLTLAGLYKGTYVVTVEDISIEDKRIYCSVSGEPLDGFHKHLIVEWNVQVVNNEGQGPLFTSDDMEAVEPGSGPERLSDFGRLAM